VLFLANDEASYVSGHTLHVAGGRVARFENQSTEIKSALAGAQLASSTSTPCDAWGRALISSASAVRPQQADCRQVSFAAVRALG